MELAGMDLEIGQVREGRHVIRGALIAAEGLESHHRHDTAETACQTPCQLAGAHGDVAGAQNGRGGNEAVGRQRRRHERHHQYGPRLAHIGKTV